MTPNDNSRLEVRVDIRISPDTLAEVDRRAKRDGWTRAEAIRFYLDVGLEEER